MFNIARASRIIFLIISILILLLFRSSPFDIHKICPFVLVPSGVLSAFYKNLFYLSGILLGVGFALLSILLPRFFCGFVCPLGTVQDILIIPSKKLKLESDINSKTNEKLSNIALFVLGTTILGTFLYRTIFCIRACPIIWTCAIGKLKMPILTMSLLGAFVLLAVCVSRAFCRYFCPYGYMLGLVSRWSIFRVKKELEVCNDCGACNKFCPMNIDIINSGEYITSSLCLSCLECLRTCNKRALKLGRKK